MRCDPFDFTPKFTLIVDANTKPRIRTTDPAMRADDAHPLQPIVPWARGSRAARTIKSRGAGNPTLDDRRGCGVAAGGAGYPATVEEASRSYLDAEDMLAEFISENW